MKNECFAPEDITVSKDKSLLQPERIFEMLGKSYWANNRPREVIRKSMEHSVCFGVYCNGLQVGFARVITDFATTYYLCDVIIDEAYRGHGLGKRMIDTIVNDEELKPLYAMLVTKDAHGLYEQYGFLRDGNKFMSKR